MAWEEALSTLHYMEKQLTIEVQSNIETLRSRMTSSKIDLVSRKAKRLYQMRVLLNTTRRLCREYEDVMADFCGVKATIETAPRGQIGKKIKLGLVMDPEIKARLESEDDLRRGVLYGGCWCPCGHHT